MFFVNFLDVCININLGDGENINVVSDFLSVEFILEVNFRFIEIVRLGVNVL